jgi:hypothetical protein
MVSASYYLTVAELNQSLGIAVNRDAAIVPVIMYLTTMSIMFRLEVSNYDDPQVALLTCLLQSALEVVLRVTAPERDAWVKRVWRRFCCATHGRRATTVVVTAPNSEDRPSSVLAKSLPAAKVAIYRAGTSERVAEAHERHAVVQRFHARMILADMWAEYAGIYMGTIALFLSQRSPLYSPYRPFRKYPELYDGGNYYGELALGTAVQVAIEIITDTLCVLLEARRGLELVAVWRELPKAALTPIVLYALYIAGLAGATRSIVGDSLDRCNHRDMCWCVGNGLQPGGVREDYCLLLYPNSSGVPTT